MMIQVRTDTCYRSELVMSPEPPLVRTLCIPLRSHVSWETALAMHHAGVSDSVRLVVKTVDVDINLI